MRTRRATKQAAEKAKEFDTVTKDVQASSPDGDQPAMAKTTRQPRVSFRVSKSQLDLPLKKNEKTSSAKQEDQSEAHKLTLEADNEPPNKRRRVTQTSAIATSNTPTPPPRKAEQLDDLNVPTPNHKSQATQKLLTIKGVIIQDGVPRKIATIITVDATQILDPDFKMHIRRGPDNPSGLTPGFSPYPYRTSPTPEACVEVHRILTSLHGETKQPDEIPPASLQVAGCGEVPCVLDALMRTLISGNTMMALANTAIKNVAGHYGTQKIGTGAGSIDWEKVRVGTHEELVEHVRVAGSGPTKARNIKRILDMVYEENLGMDEELRGPVLLSLDHLRGMGKDEVLARLVAYPGIGIKTAACVTLFCLRIPCFAVDTHVLRFSRWLGWVPQKADADNCFRHGDVMVPDGLKYGLHQLFIRHGQQCFRCRKASRPGTKEWEEADVCPLEGLVDRGKDGGGNGDEE